jgi:hypothetical protein
MMGDHLSKREDRTLHRTMESVILTQFPNPERKDCPGTAVLRTIAKKRISMQDPALDHAGRCSPCFAELTDIRRALRKQNVVWIAGTAAAAVVLIAAFVGYFGSQEGKSPTPEPQQIAAVLDLRNASASRAAQVPGSEQPSIEIPRGLLKLTINLPVGSEEGLYEVQIRKLNEPASLDVNGHAGIKGGITELSVEIDTTSLPGGIYDFSWRMAGFDWRVYPILIH